MCLQPLVGLLSDKIGRRPILIAFGVLGTLCTVPLLTTLSTASNALEAFFIIIAALVIVSGYTAINAVVKAELFPTGVRALGLACPMHSPCRSSVAQPNMSHYGSSRLAMKAGSTGMCRDVSRSR